MFVTNEQFICLLYFIKGKFFKRKVGIVLI